MRKLKYSKPTTKTTYSTKQYIEMIEKRMDYIESLDLGGRWCPVNTIHCIQCRGKDLKRVLKKRPNWVLRGRKIVQISERI